MDPRDHRHTGTCIVERPTRTTLRVRRARLEVIRGPDRGMKREVKELHLQVGGGPDCDMVLSDTAVSRKHFELFPEEDGFRVRDLGSKNGTVIRGLMVTEALLFGGEEIEAGRSILLLSLTDEHDEFLLSSENAFGTMIGRSVAIRRLFAELERVAPTNATLLLEGESGTGKDLAAENVHKHSERKDKPFIVFDCGAVSPSLVESELFGHCKGAFTGADRDRPGVFESADGGTAFLDEIGEIPLAIQPKLLRLLDKWETKRVGENTYRPVNVRLILATNRDLANEVMQGAFREDLYYRLSVVRMRMPALRDRREDISLLAKEFVTKRAPDMDSKQVINDQVLAMFMNHSWPGNVRELRNVVDRLLLFPERPESAIATTKDEPAAADIPANFLDLSFREFQQQSEKAYLSSVIDACGGVMSRAAQKAGLPRQTFYRLVNKYKLTR